MDILSNIAWCLFDLCVIVGLLLLLGMMVLIGISGFKVWLDEMKYQTKEK